jgi:hypothetical protein
MYLNRLLNCIIILFEIHKVNKLGMNEKKLYKSRTKVEIFDIFHMIYEIILIK